MPTKNLYSLVGMRIRAFRKLRDIKQSEIADDTGINRATISNIESGKQQVSLDYLYKIAHALGTEVFSLLPTLKEVNIVKDEHQNRLNEKMDEQNLDDSIKSSIFSLLNKVSNK